MTNYTDRHRSSIEHPEEFWAEAAEGIDWEKPWDKVLEKTDSMTYRWFPGAELNTCFNAVDRHVMRGRAEQTAIIHDSPVTSTQRKISYAELLDEVSQFAGALAANGIGKGDRVIVYMPMIPEAIVAVLACARLGAVHSVVFGGFAANELATRIDDATPKADRFGILRYRAVAHRRVQAAARSGDRTIDAQARTLHRAAATAGNSQSRPRSRYRLAGSGGSRQRT